MIELTHADWSLSVRPELGAAVTRLTWRGLDILRPAADGATSPLETGSFPLVPYANRIAGGAFHVASRAFTLPPTPGFEPHALHGVGWLRPWSVARSGNDVVDLVLASDASPDWPWAWTALLRLRLDTDGLDVSLALTNADREPMPAGLGLHPYFAAGAKTVLTAPAPNLWLTDAAGIPDQLAPASSLIDWSEGASIASAPFVDHAYADWTGQARLEHSRHVVSLTASPNARWLQIYAPGDKGFICIEPMTQRPDAHNAPAGEAAGLNLLASGQTLTLSMRISATDRTRAHGDNP